MTPQQKWTDGLFRNVLATIPLIVMFGGFLWAQSGWQAAVELRLKGAEERQSALALEQAAGRGRGDALRLAVADTQRSVAIVQAKQETANDLLTEIRTDVKRLMERRFGGAAPTGTTLSDGQPWQAQ